MYSLSPLDQSLVEVSMNETSIDVLCMACDQTCNFRSVKLQRRVMGDEDIEIAMKYCGVCHSDLHIAAGHLSGVTESEYPCVPGHELCGIITKVGRKVIGFSVGDPLGVGCIVDSCLKCSECTKGNEHKCLNGQVATYQSSNKYGRAAVAGQTKLTLGGYTSTMIIHHKFAIKIPKSYPLEMAGPIMCAGVTMYSPLINHGCKFGTAVCIVALGGLGQMGVRISKALGANVTVISSSASKKELAFKTGADAYIVSTEKEQMASSCKKFDIILNTIPSYHNYLMYQPLLKDTGIQVLLGLHAGFAASMILTKLRGGKSRITSSSIGSIKETQDVINLVDKHKIYPDIVIVPCSQLNQIYTDLDSNNATGNRYVLDIANTLKEDVSCGNAPTIKPDNQRMSICTIITELVGLICCCRCC